MTLSTDAADAPSRRAQRKTRGQEVARTQLLDAAEEVLGAKGLHATTIKEIAELAEFSVGSVYLFFSSKDDLVARVLERRGHEMTDGMRAVVAGRGSALERLLDLVDFQVGFFRTRPSFGRLYLGAAAIGALLPDTARSPEAQARLHEAMTMTADLIAEGQAAGEICGGEAKVLARLFSGIISAYQATDPSVTGDGPSTSEPVSLGELRAFVERAFRVRRSRP